MDFILSTFCANVDLPKLLKKKKKKQHLSLLLHVFWGLAITYRANLRWLWASLLAQMVKNGAYNAGSLGWQDPLEKN